ncbi:MAG TPA: hypothetical protein PLX97_04295, partial [Gemmatales bacterium]|nr:hypothetical protein [Gemmatales bacterium]
MAAEADNPKTGIIAWVTTLSLILIFVVFVVLQGLFQIWEVRHDKRTGTGNLDSPLVAYKKEQELKLVSLEAAKKTTLEPADITTKATG